MKNNIKIQINSDLSSKSQTAFTLENTSKFGEKKDNKIIYSKFEAYFLMELKKAELKKVPRFTKQEKINYIVFKDLRKKGYIVKTAQKFGTEFRIYKKTQKHATHLVKPIKNITTTQLTALTRIAHSTKKKLLLAIIDDQEDITYLEIDWKKP